MAFNLHVELLYWCFLLAFRYFGLLLTMGDYIITLVKLFFVGHLFLNCEGQWVWWVDFEHSVYWDELFLLVWIHFVARSSIVNSRHRFIVIIVICIRLHIKNIHFWELVVRTRGNQCTIEWISKVADWTHLGNNCSCIHITEGSKWPQIIDVSSRFNFMNSACISTCWCEPDWIYVKISSRFQGLSRISIFIAIVLLFSTATYPAIFVLSKNDKVLLVETWRQKFRFLFNFCFNWSWIVFSNVNVHLWRVFKWWCLASNNPFVGLFHVNWRFADIVRCLFTLVKSLVKAVDVFYLMGIKRRF